MAPGSCTGSARQARTGPATAKYRELGTLANLLAYNAISALPTRNFQASSFEGAARLTDEPASAASADVEGMRRVARSSCASCTIGCEHIYRASGKGGGKRAGGEGGPGGGKRARVEYQNVYALGPLCGVDDPGAVLAASALCDDLIVAAKRAFNVREGWQPADDWLPERLLSEPLTLPSGREARLTPERLRAMIAAY
ncbi:MAG TPA: aldehyde ferredoxin oxidoreductase C-terminal domain-containing protein [Trebonia sp.]|nr:aldehyde ferredoxin oxidoreductase C-terminal domain-containing protein [Trebonia sp.]